MSIEKVLSLALASTPLASPHVEVCKGINGLDNFAEIDVDLVEECMRMIASLQRVARAQSSQHLIKEISLTRRLAIANARIRSLEERIRDFEFHEGQLGPQIHANQEPPGHEEVGSSKGGPKRSSRRRTRGPNDA